MPGAVVAWAVTVSVLAPAAAIGFAQNALVAPGGRPETDSVSGVVRLFMGARDMVYAPRPPAVTLWALGAAESRKSGADETVMLTFCEWTAPLLAVAPTVNG